MDQCQTLSPGFNFSHKPLGPPSTMSRGKIPNATSSQLYQQTKQIAVTASKRPGLHSRSSMAAAGFVYTGEGDKARCETCGLEVSNLTSTINPYTIHSQRSPDCPFVRSLQVTVFTSSSASSTALGRSTTKCEETENPSKRQKTETLGEESFTYSLQETTHLERARRRSFSHWPDRTIPSIAQMIEAGFFCCNVGDRVICLYCNLICQQWTPHTDDPCEVHKTLSPHCIFVKSKLIRPSNSSILIVNENSATTVSTGSQSPTSHNLEAVRSHEIVHTAACNPAYIELPKRYASFATWPAENLPSADDLVRSGFFYSGTKTVVTCFYCNGSLQNWGPNDNPMIEHARWFPHCAYAKQLCGDDLYRKVQESKRAQQERAKASELRERGGSQALATTNTATTKSQQLQIPDESTLSRLVAARLDLPVSQRLLTLGFKLSIIKRCWEDQLRLKHDDFTSDCDLFIACTVLQKQIEHIDGKKENIVIPSLKMKQIRERNLNQHNQATLNSQTSTTSVNDVDMSGSQTSTNDSSCSTESNPKSTNITETPKIIKPSTAATVNAPDSSNSSNSNNLCVLCWNEEKRLACIPCGHLATCVPCGHSLRSCPICRREIEAFVRVYI